MGGQWHNRDLILRLYTNDRTLPIEGATYNLEVDGHEIADGTGGRWSDKLFGVLKFGGGYISVPFRCSDEVEAAQIMSTLIR